MKGLLKIISKGITGIGRKITKGANFMYESTKEGLESLKEYYNYKKYSKNTNEKDISKYLQNYEDPKFYLNPFIKDKTEIYEHLNLLDKMYLDKEISKKKHDKLKNILYQKTIDAIEEYNSPKNQIMRFWEKVAACVFLFGGMIILVQNPSITGNTIREIQIFSIKNILGIILIFLFFILIYHKKTISKKELNKIFNK